VDDARFQEARQAYDSGDYRHAAKQFLAAAGEGVDGNGAAYHMAGNALMRLRRYGDAVTVYGHALNDRVYDKHGAVYFNLAAAQTALGEYAGAVQSYQSAIDEPGYKTPYKALQGMASAQLEMGRTEEAAVAYRAAALDEANPNPGAAIVNLGLCLMALGRPGDAAEAYKAALGFDSYSGRGKALANLGQAYHASGQESEAVRAFETAEHMHAHTLSAAATADYEASLAAVNASQALQADREVVDGWVTGGMPPVIEPPSESPSESTGWGTGELEALDASNAEQFVPVEHDDPGRAPSAGALDSVVSDEEDVEAFFNRTESDMRELDKQIRRDERSARRVGQNGWTLVLIVAGVLAAITLVLAALYFAGYGWPTQRQTTTGLLDAQIASKTVDAYWVAVPELDVKKEMAKIPPAKSFAIDKVDSSAATSTVAVTVTPVSGSPLHYRVTLQREGVGWRVSGIENDW
jgi:tetratricopeptide (TPR) repeat protein